LQTRVLRAMVVAVFFIAVAGVCAQSQPQAASAAAATLATPPQPASRVWLDPDGKPLPFHSDDEVMEFLRTARVVQIKDIPVGVAHPREALLEKDGVRAHAKFSSVHEEKDKVQMANGQREFGFRDDAIFDCAAQEIAKLLGMDNLPPVVERTIQGEKGILQIWLENAMTEKDRLKNKQPPPNAGRWNDQIQVMRFFDNLVYNTDRNAGNILIDKDWKVWLIDHTRAFRKYDELLNANTMLVLDRGIWEKLLALDEGLLKQRVKPYLRTFEIDGLLNRRKKIIEHFRKEIAERGESEVIHDMK